MEMRCKQIKYKYNVTNQFCGHHSNFHNIKHELCDRTIKYCFHYSYSMYFMLNCDHIPSPASFNENGF